MKKFLLIFLSVLFLCSCTAKPDPGLSVDNSTSPPDTLSLSETNTNNPDPFPIFSPYFTHINAVALTWGEPIPEDDANYNEIHIAGNGSTFIPVRVEYDEVFYPTFRYNGSRYPSDFPDTATKESQNHFVYVSKDVINQFPVGTKQLVFLDFWNRMDTPGNIYYIDTRRKFNGTSFQNYHMQPIFNIIDGKIIFPDDFEEYSSNPLDGTEKYDFSLFVGYANQTLKKDFPDLSLFEDGMLISDFSSYIDKVLSYLNSDLS